MLTKKEFRHAMRYIKRFKRTKATFDAVREARRRPVGSHFFKGKDTMRQMRKGAQPLTKQKRGFFARIFKRTGV